MWKHLRYSLPFTIFCFAWFSAGGMYEYYAQGQLEWTKQAIGFPFFWMFDEVNSLSFTVAVFPLVVDLVIYFFVCSLLLHNVIKYLETDIYVKWGLPIIFIALSLPWFLCFFEDVSYIPYIDTTGYQIKIKGYTYVIFSIVN